MPSYSRRVEVSGRSAQEIYEKVAGDIERFLDKAALGKSEIERDSKSKQVVVKSSLFSATLACKDGCINVDAKLSLLAAPFKSKLDDGIDRWLAKAFKST